MIYEVRTYTLRSGTLADFEERYASRLALREKHSSCLRRHDPRERMKPLLRLYCRGGFLLRWGRDRGRERGERPCSLRICGLWHQKDRRTRAPSLSFSFCQRLLAGARGAR